MSMHLAHPSLSTMGKKKGIKKFRNAKEAQRARELSESWKQLDQKWSESSHKAVKPVGTVNKLPSYNYRGRDNPKPVSIDSGITGAVSSKPIPQYTGDKLLGICQMPKSNAVPIYNPEHIIEIGRMRR